jgi:cell division protein FtsL
MTDEQVIEALYKALMSSLEKAIPLAVDTVVAGILVKLDEKETELAALRQKVDDLSRPTVVWTMSPSMG